MATKEVSKSFSSALTEVPKGWKFDLPKSELSLSADLKKSLVADLPKASPYIAKGLNPYHSFLGQYYYNAVRHETLQWAKGKEFRYNVWPWPTNEKAICPPHPYSSMSWWQFFRETAQMRNMGPVYRGLLFTFLAFVPLRGYLAENANKSGQRAGPLYEHTPQHANNDPRGVYIGPFRVPFEFPNWFPGRV